MLDHLTADLWVRLSDWTWTPTFAAWTWAAIVVILPVIGITAIIGDSVAADRRSRRVLAREDAMAAAARDLAERVRAEVAWLDRLDAREAREAVTR